VSYIRLCWPGTGSPGRRPGASAHGALPEEHALRRNTEFEDFYQASYGRLVALLLAVLGDKQEAEDVAQEAFARALPAGPG
jgi:DNA-directed RNA polymerase specialized sigma24 family protein